MTLVGKAVIVVDAAVKQQDLGPCASVGDSSAPSAAVALLVVGRTGNYRTSRPPADDPGVAVMGRSTHYISPVIRLARSPGRKNDFVAVFW